MRQSGNGEFNSTKEMLHYIIDTQNYQTKRVDDIHDDMGKKMDRQDCLAESRVSTKTFWSMVGIGSSLIGLVISGLIIIIKKIYGG